MASFFPSSDSAECNCSFKWKEENVDTAWGEQGPAPPAPPLSGAVAFAWPPLCPPAPEPPTLRLMITDLAVSPLHGHAATWLVPLRQDTVGTTVTASAGVAGNGAEKGFGVIHTHLDENFHSELEKILTN